MVKRNFSLLSSGFNVEMGEVFMRFIHFNTHLSTTLESLTFVSQAFLSFAK